MTEDNIVEKIKYVIKTKVRPILVMDGGNIEFEDYKDGVVSVSLMGACDGCPLATITLKNTVKSLLQESVPEVKDVVDVDFEEEE